MVYSPVPDYKEDLHIAGLKDEVKVYRDSHAIPHIYAKNEHDLYMVTGYLMAQDRLWQMDLFRRITLGRLSEIFGEDFVDTDLVLRSLRINEKSLGIMETLNPDIKKIAQAFADGINQYIEQHSDNLPLEFQILGYEMEPWKLEYSINLIGFMAWNLNTPWHSEVVLYKISNSPNMDEELFEYLIPNIGNQGLVQFPDFKILREIEEEGFQINEIMQEIEISLLDKMKDLTGIAPVFMGSNNWVVSSEKSETGNPILANDMHLGFGIPSIWYQIHQVVDDQLNVTGLALPGSPFVIAGHNENIAWGMTNVMVDDTDFYIEKTNENNQYLYQGEWYDMVVQEEEIKTGSDDSVTRTLYYTNHGPIITDMKEVQTEENIEISMRWIGNEESNELMAVYLLNRAKNWEDFLEAVKNFRSISQNINYADTEGNIGLQCCAGVPIRQNHNGLGIYPGWTGEHEWTGFVPFDELPRSFNPERGYIASANSYIVNDYPYYITYWYDLPFRLTRIVEMLEEKDKLSIQDFKQMHMDIKSVHVEVFKKLFLNELRKVNGFNEVEKKCLEILEQWDENNLTTSSAAAVIYEKTFIKFIENTFKDEMGEELYEEWAKIRYLPNHALRNIIDHDGYYWFDDITTEGEVESFYEIVVKSFKEAIFDLMGSFGCKPEEYQWGKLHTLTLKHPLGEVAILDYIFNFNRGPFPMPGSYHTVFAMNYSFINPFIISWGVSQRHIYNLGDWDISQSLIPVGTSGQPGSDYYADQTELFLNGEYHNDFISRDLIESNAVYQIICSPSN